jgi:hypothetical protein
LAVTPPSTWSAISRPVAIDHLPQRGDLGELAGDEGLAAEARIDRHDQDQVHQVHHMRQHVSTGRARVQHHAGLLPQRPDGLEAAVQMRPGLGMQADEVGAGLGEGGEVRIRRRDHQMDVEGHFAVRPQRLDEAGAEADVRARNARP